MKEVKNFYDKWEPESFPNYIQLLINFADELIFEELNLLLKKFKNFKNKEDFLVLDCGCGFGAFYNLTKDFNTLYLDISLNLLKKFKLNERKICANILHLPFKDEVFDLVVCINVLEHVNHLNALNEIKRVLKNNGKLIVVVVNKDSLIKEEIFNDFEIYHRPLSAEDFKVNGFKINYISSVYYLPSIFKIFPPIILSKILKHWKIVDKKLSKIFKNRGQFLIIEMVKE
ncbi:class I SAM-dependent methyltransferase [Methanocaldococcus fervens]|uniref:Methyltransferase type 11 n=1 Tax=Methanocaldococcus fervens (strain DSM 4213 / JCM 15782 / AG86) TaxID=573064 RepID=C7P6A4_METFA|nr:class I SAM-dependent methyltransferase [Methanocaldococcus fervens]ACV24086.1 Methyltransferase type 11 [Methanocaldococcus fervens AG86]